MAKDGLLTPERLRQLVRYEPETGRLFWRTRTPEMFKIGRINREKLCEQWNRQNAGKEAFIQVTRGGYRSGWIKANYKAHRVAFAIFYGRWPGGEVDHINGDRADNRINNLRDVPKSENARNVGVGVRNTSGIMGVTWNKRSRRWSAQIFKGGKMTILGRFETIEEAARVRSAAERELGYQQGHGRRSSYQRALADGTDAAATPRTP